MRKKQILLFCSIFLCAFFLLTGCNKKSKSTSTEGEKFTVVWKNEDGTVLERDTNVLYGTMPKFDGETPTKQATAECNYIFSGWDKSLNTVIANVTYVAKFTSAKNKYTVTWKNIDGTVLETDTNVLYGTIPSYNNPKPYYPNSRISCSGWDTPIQEVTQDVTYTAKYGLSDEECSRDGEYITLGSYPQSEVKSKALLELLNSSYNELPTKNNSQSWTSYGYYISGSNETNYMWYKDVTINYEKYRGVYFTNYRPSFLSSSSAYDYSYQDDNGYELKTVYWFKYEPLKWRILSEANEQLTVLCENIIDSQHFYNDVNKRTINEKEVYANDWEYSTIREWLNNDFYNTAFNELQKGLIRYTTIDNKTTADNGEANVYASNQKNTNERMYLLSYADMTNAEYGFTSNETRQKEASAYAKIQGAEPSKGTSYEGNGTWLLRSPYSNGAINSSYVNSDGEIDNYSNVKSTYYGIVPVMTIKDVDIEYTVDWKNGDDSNLETDKVKYGRIADYDGETPTKEKTAEYTYTFSNWDQDISIIRWERTFSPEFSSVRNKYDITWQNEDGSTLLVDNVEYGSTPSYSGATPKKAATAENINIFAGWDKVINYVIGVDTYKATYVTRPISSDALYTRESNYIYFGEYPQKLVGNISQELNYLGGVLPSAANSQSWTSYGYYINGSNETNYMWYKDVTYNEELYRGVYFTSYRPNSVTNYSTESNTYQDDNGFNTSNVYWFKYEPIKWKILKEANGKATLLCDMVIDAQAFQNTYQYDEGMYYNNNSQTTSGHFVNDWEYSTIRSWLNDNFYNLAFNETQKKLIDSQSFEDIYMSYKYDNVYLLESSDMQKTDYGFVNSIYATTTRTKVATDYAKIQGVYVSTNSSSLGNSKWRLRSKNNDSMSLNNISVDGSICLEQDFNYCAKGIVPSITIRLIDEKYSVTWQNEDGTSIKVDENVIYGQKALYVGTIPTKAATIEYTYTFAGWDNELVGVSGNQVYKATFTSTKNKYDVTWQNEDGSVIKIDKVEYGVTPSYVGDEPTKTATSEYTYTFAGWDNEIVSVSGDQVYKATFTSTKNKYDVTWQNEDGSVIKIDKVEYGVTPSYVGDEPTKTATSEYTYTFAGWNNEIVSVSGDQVYKATFTSTPISNE